MNPTNLKGSYLEGRPTTHNPTQVISMPTLPTNSLIKAEVVMEKLGDCMLCRAALREFAPDSNTCPAIDARFCPCGELEQLEGQIRNLLHQALKKW